MPQVEWSGSPTPRAQRQPARARRRWSSERTLFGVAAGDRARSTRALNQLNPISRADARRLARHRRRRARSTTSCVQALRDLGLDQRDARARRRPPAEGRHALPARPRRRSASSPRGLEEVLVVEEKLPFLETRAASDALYGAPDAPRVVGKRDEHGAPLLPRRGRARRRPIAPRRRLAARRPRALETRRRARRALEARRARAAARPLPLARTPFFCSGCPHNTSTGDPGRHAASASASAATRWCCSRPRARARSPASRRWAARARSGRHGAVHREPALRPERRRRHVPPLGLAGASAAPSPPGVNITYKLLYNDAVAMTGGQDVARPADDPRADALAGARGRQADHRHHRGARALRRRRRCDPIAEVRHRDDARRAQAELARDRRASPC